MINVKFIKAGELKAGDQVVNLGKIDKVEHFEHSIDNQPCVNLTITTGIVRSAAFYWIKSSELIAIHC